MKWTLLLLCVATLPLPFFGAQSGVAPPARLLFIGSLVGGVLVQDPGTVTILITALYLGQGLLWTALLYFVVRFVSKRLQTRSQAVQRVLLCALAVVLIGSSLFPIYRTPMSSSGVHTSILELFD
jgi:hypothetical protein